MPDRERKRVPGYWSDILKGSLGSPRVHWQCGNHTEMPTLGRMCRRQCGNTGTVLGHRCQCQKRLIGFVRQLTFSETDSLCKNAIMIIVALVRMSCGVARGTSFTHLRTIIQCLKT